MAPIDSPEQLLEALARFHLLDSEQLTTFTEELVRRFSTVSDATRDLVARGWLSAFQANELILGRASGLLLGSYVLEEKLGEGGMGVVYRARNWKLGREVALKVLRNEEPTNTSVQRFRREIRSAAVLDHPQIVRALDADQHEDRYFLVMEYADGINLARLVREKGPMPIAQACDCIWQAANGLAHAHRQNIVHRDIKPSNLLLTPQGMIKILDMGLARTIRIASEQETTHDELTQEGAFVGTVDYCAPEQAMDARSVDIRADLYSLGCTMYFLLTGQPPFAGDSFMERLVKHRECEPRSVQDHRPETPDRVAAIVHRLLAKNPDDRYQTPAELADAIQQVRQQNPTGIVVEESIGFPLILSPEEFPHLRPSNEKAGRRAPNWLFAVALSTLIVFGVLAGSAWYFWPDEPTRNEEGKPRASSGPTKAEIALRVLNERFEDPAIDRGKLVPEILEYRAKFGDEPGAFRTTALMLAKCASPLDALQAEDVPERFRTGLAVEHGSKSDLVAAFATLPSESKLEFRSLAVAPDGRHVVVGVGLDREGILSLWHLPKGTHKRSYPKYTQPVSDVAFSPSNEFFSCVADHDHRVHLWSVDSDLPLEQFQSPNLGQGYAHYTQLRCLDFSGGGNRLLLGGGYAAGGLDIGHDLRLFDTRSGKHLFLLQGHTAPVIDIALSGDGRRAISISEDRTVRYWDLEKGEELSHWSSFDLNGQAISLDPRGREAMVVVETGQFWFVDIERNQRLVQGPEGWSDDPLQATTIRTVAYSPTGTLLASGSEQGWIVVKKANRRTTVGEYRLPHPIVKIVFSADGRYLLAGCRTGNVYVFRIQPSPK